MKIRTKYYCEYCNKDFETEASCQAHEEAHAVELNIVGKNYTNVNPETEVPEFVFESNEPYFNKVFSDTNKLGNYFAAFTRNGGIEYEDEDEKELLDLMVQVYRMISTLEFMDDPEVFIPADKSKGLKDVKEFIELLLAKSEKQ